jgi:hypothetical protein
MCIKVRCVGDLDSGSLTFNPDPRFLGFRQFFYNGRDPTGKLFCGVTQTTVRVERDAGHYCLFTKQ